LRGLFNEDWGPKWCTACNLRCGQTCWNIDGITKQLHQRELKVSGGEVVGQNIRGKQIRGRVNWDELGKTLEKGVVDLMSGNIDLAAAFDPERNGVAAAFRKFGDDVNGALNEIQRGIKDGFDKMGADAKAAFEKLAKDAESTFKQFGDELVAKLKNPDFWVEFAAIMTEVALYAAAAVVTATGVGAAFAPGLLAAAAMAGPAIRMIGDAAQGRPIDALDIAELAISGASAAIPGLAGVTKTAMKAGVQAAKVTVTIVKAGQDLGMIPSSCLGPNCPAPPPPPGPEPPLDPPFPAPPPPVGQLTDEEIEALQPENTIKRMLKNPRRENPDYIPAKDWIAQYRAQSYGDNTLVEPGNGALTTPEDKLINQETTVPVTEPPTQIPDGEELFPPLGESSDFPAFESSDFPAFESSDFPAFETGTDFPAFETGTDFPAFETGTDFPAFETTDFPVESEVTIPEVPIPEVPVSEITEPTRIISEEEIESDSFIPRAIVGGLRGGNIENLPIIEMNVNGDVFSNPWGTMTSTRAKSQIPLTHTGAEFNPDCYARKNPEIAKEVGNDKDKLTTHWFDIGAKAGLDADCAETTSSVEERIKLMFAAEQERERVAGLRTNCAATDGFWIEAEKRCDGMRHADGRPNLRAEKCVGIRNNGWHNGKCMVILDSKGKRKTPEDFCNARGFAMEDDKCRENKNPDGSIKTPAEVCDAYDGFWTGTECDSRRNKDGEPRTEQELCEENGRTYNPNATYNVDKCRWTRETEDLVDKEVRTNYSQCQVLGVNHPDCDRTAYIPFDYGSIAQVIHYVSKALPDALPRNLPKKIRLKRLSECMKEQAAIQRKKYEEEENIFRWGYIDDWRITPFLVDSIELGRNPGQDGIIISEKHHKQAIELYNKCKPLIGKGKPKSLTLYWAEWCPHCHDLMPEWEKLGDGYKGVTIEAIEEQDSDVKVDGYPTIIFRNGRNMEKYEGERTKNAILKFLKNKLSIK
jgi:thiol-disulfide isomerase/thioredoxin